MQAPLSAKPRSLTITLRGEQYKAERLTTTHYVALGGLVWEKGAGMPNLDTPAVKQQVAEQMLYKFGDPEFMKRLCYSLLAIFPSLATNNLVWFQPDGNMTPPWGTALEPDEILQIITDVANAIQGNDYLAPSDMEALKKQQEKAAKIAELEQAIAELKQL